MARPLRIAFVTVEDASDKRSWSGSLFHMASALRRAGVELELIGPLRPRPLLFLLRAFNQLALRLLGKRYHYRDSFILSKAYASIIEGRLKDKNVDLVLAPAGLAAIAHLRATMPIIYFDDRCLAGAMDYHAVLSGLFRWSREQSLELERLALRNAALVIYASEWAASAARMAYTAEVSKIHVIPMGVNFDELPPPPKQRDFPAGRINLLMIGVDWVNKGGPVAYEALRELKRRGHQARLVVCGCEVPTTINDPDVVSEGFLRKDVPDERERLEQHLREAHFFILPTRFEAYGIAFCEAAAYGIPALGTHTGGVPTIVQDGVTGCLFALDSNGAAYADRIEELQRDAARWQAMRSAARKRAEEVFTWDAFANALVAQVEASGLVNKAR